MLSVVENILLKNKLMILKKAYLNNTKKAIEKREKELPISQRMQGKQS